MKSIASLSVFAILTFSISCQNTTHENAGQVNVSVQDDNQGHENEHQNEHKDGHDHNQSGVIKEEHGNITETYTLSTLELSDFSFIYKTSGKILTGRKDEVMISASSPGIISFYNDMLYPGARVREGQQLFIISGNDLTDYNTEVNFQRLQSDYLAANDNYERAERLVKDKLITMEHYLELKREYENTKAQYDNYRKRITDGVRTIDSPYDGFLDKVNIEEGEMVHTGDIIATMVKENKLVLKAEIPQADMDILKSITGANFKPAYSNILYTTDDLGGSIISYGRSSDENTYYIPLYFSIKYIQDLIPGSYTDIWLIGKPLTDVLLVPEEALMEEFGKFYVFRLNDYGEFEKVYITTGKSDGRRTHVINGLAVGDRIVTEGAYQVKLAMDESGIPDSHSHNH